MLGGGLRCAGPTNKTEFLTHGERGGALLSLCQRVKGAGMGTELEARLDEFRARGLSLNMARGKPGADQLALSMPMLDVLTSRDELIASDGTDCGNYGGALGIPEARSLIADMLSTTPEHVIVGGSSSLALMFQEVSRGWGLGFAGCEPWSRQEGVRFLCPSPGYDRHFKICEHFGIEMIPIELESDGPDMGRVRELVEGDARVKGIWCVPQYANPTGITYSDSVVEEFASLEPAAADFRIFWDNAYVVHHLYDEAAEQDHVADILSACERAGHPDMVFEFCSTSKVTFPGAGISGLAASEANVAEIAAAMGISTICNDKINQLRHARFLTDADGIAAHMRKHAALIRPKFQMVLSVLDEELKEMRDAGLASWSEPRGGYFVSFSGPSGTARRAVELARSAGVTMTGAGATWPYGRDPRDSNVRIAPTMPPLEELEVAMRVFSTCVKIAYDEKVRGV